MAPELVDLNWDDPTSWRLVTDALPPDDPAEIIAVAAHTTSDTVTLIIEDDTNWRPGQGRWLH